VTCDVRQIDTEQVSWGLWRLHREQENWKIMEENEYGDTFDFESFCADDLLTISLYILDSLG